MAVSGTVLADTQLAFDSVANEYAASNEGNPLLRDMRARTLAKVFAHVPLRSELLDMGCGPGTDVELLARAGYTVTAIDWSPAMVDETRRRIRECGLEQRVAVHHAGVQDLDTLPSAAFDAALSNFGPLNCVHDLSGAARAIARRLGSGGTLIASVIGRVCPWEIAVHLSRGQFDRVRIRFRPGMVPVPLNGRTVWMRYYSPREFEAAFAPAGFTRVSVEALGFFSPPPYMDAFATRHPRLIRQLQRMDERLGSYPPFRSWGDHFLIVFRKA